MAGHQIPKSFYQMTKMKGLSNFIVNMTAFILLDDKIQGERLDFDTPP